MAPRRRRLPHPPDKVCGSCRYLLRPPFYNVWRLRKACRRIVEANRIRVEDLTRLVREVLTLNNKRYWCSREKCWTHLLDYCSLWEPRKETEENLTLSRSSMKAAP